MSDHDHQFVEHLDAAATIVEREPARIYGTVPTAILGTAGAAIGLGVGSPQTALLFAMGIVVIGAILELVRSRVSPATVTPFTIPDADS